MSDDEIKEEMYQDMLLDSKMEMLDKKKEHNLENDYAEFEIYFADELQQFTEALEDIKKLYKQYNHEFCCKEF